MKNLPFRFSCFLIATASTGMFFGFPAAPLYAQSPAIVTGADSGGTTAVNTYRSSGSLTGSFSGASPAFNGGVRVGSGDVTGDGYVDIITAEGNGGSTVRVYTGPTHTLTYAVSPFGSTYNLGLYVAGGDIDRDGHADIVVGAGAGGTPQVKVISGSDGSTTLANFFAFPVSFTGGVRVASGDINRDGYADILAGSGPGGGEIRVFSGKDFTLANSFFPFGNTFTGGLHLGVADVNHDGFTDIIVGSGSGLGQVKVFSGKDLTVMASFLPFGAAFSGEVRVAGADLNGDGYGDLIAGQGPGGSSLLNVYDGQTLALTASFQPYGPSSVGIFVGAVPEPGSAVVVVAALGALAWVRRRK